MFMNCDEQFLLRCPMRPAGMDHRKWKAITGIGGDGAETAPLCPRCASANTKFCYYNNYSLSQPRYLCKSCRRYWTKGGSLRNVPIGGGCRKSRRSAARSIPTATSTGSSKSQHGSDSGYSAVPGSGTHGSNPHSLGSSVPSTDGLNGPPPEIDLAMVFAKFLNQNSGCEQNEMMDPRAGQDQIGYLDPSSQETELSDELNYEDFMKGELPITNGFRLPELAGDESRVYDIGHHNDIFWPLEGPNFNNAEPNLTWGEFEMNASDDQLQIISTGVLCDNWSSFDVSTL